MTETKRSITIFFGVVALVAFSASFSGLLTVGCRLWDLLPDRNPPATDTGWQLDWDIEDLTTGEITFED
jgi:hypothetical protein